MITFTRLFPVWAISGVLLAILVPDWLVPLQAAIVPLLGLVMFGMGMTLTTGNFVTILQRPLPVLLGLTCLYAGARFLIPFAGL